MRGSNAYTSYLGQSKYKNFCYTISFLSVHLFWEVSDWDLSSAQSDLACQAFSGFLSGF